MQPDRLSTTFAALADPTRRAILARLALGVASVTELAEPFEMSLPAVSKHLKVLERAGLIARGRDAQSRPSRLKPGPLKDVAGWLEHYRKFWEEGFDRLDNYLRELQTKEEKHGRKKEPCHGIGRARRPHHAAFRRASQSGLRGLDRTARHGAVVGAARVQEHRHQDGPAAGRHLSLPHAWTRRR